jgi:hypothetical protein
MVIVQCSVSYETRLQPKRRPAVSLDVHHPGADPGHLDYHPASGWRVEPIGQTRELDAERQRVGHALPPTRHGAKLGRKVNLRHGTLGF